MVSGQLRGGYNELMPDIHQTFQGMQTALNQDFNQAASGQSAAIRQRAKQSGMPFSTEQLSDAQTQAAMYLDQQKNQAMGRLKFAEAETNMGQFNQLMNLMGGASQTAIGLGQGSGQIWNSAIAGLPNSTRGGNILGGAAGGAAAGTAIVPGWGTAIGAILGGIGGAFSYGG